MFSRDQLTPVEEIRSRITRLQSRLAALGIDGALIFQKADLFYFCGTIQQGQLFIPAEGEPLLMVRKSAERARAESPIEHQAPLSSQSDVTRLLDRHGFSRPRRIGLELDVIPAKLYLAIKALFDGSDAVDISHEIRLLRSVKSDREIAVVREAARRADQVAGFVAEVLEEGISEVALAGKVEAEARRLGHQGFVRMRLWDHERFYGHLMAGPGAAAPSYLASPTGGAALSPAVARGSSLRPIRAREPILVDYVFAMNGYLAGHTRIFAVEGLDDDLMRAHQAALDLQAELLEEIRPGVAAGRIYELAVSRAADPGNAGHFMDADASRIRFVGHGIGLELDEYPFLAKDQTLGLEAGMTIALEPKMILPDRGVVGIENTHVVTKTGSEQLTRYPEQVTVV